MSFAVQWLPLAEVDLERHFEALNDKSPAAASKAARSIFNAAASLSIFPNRGRSKGRNNASL